LAILKPSIFAKSFKSILNNVKNISLAINGILTIAVGILFYFHFSSSAPGTAPKAAGMKKDSVAGPVVKPSDLKASDIVYINLDTLNAGYKMIVDNSKVLNNKQSVLESDYRRMKEKLQSDYESAQKAAQAGTLSAAAQEEVSGRLGNQKNELDQKEAQLRNIETEYAREQAEVMKKLYDYLARYNASGHYRFILPYSGNAISPVLFGRKDLDITADVLTGLNAEYKASKSGK
jgi:outer membrane protein